MMLQETDPLVYDITIHAGADYQLDLLFEEDDGTPIYLYDLDVDVADGILFDNSGSTVSDEELSCVIGWSVEEGETLVANASRHYTEGDWNAEAQLRAFPEHRDAGTFVCIVDAEGFHLKMSRTVTAELKFARGAYDVFVLTPEGRRMKLIQGMVRIIPDVTRGLE